MRIFQNEPTFYLAALRVAHPHARQAPRLIYYKVGAIFVLLCPIGRENSFSVYEKPLSGKNR
jgi:hypothetical protein